jgi:hypothetical protein
MHNVRDEITAHVKNRKPIPWGPILLPPTAANASYVYQRRIRDILREGRVEVDPESYIDVTCGSCSLEHRIKRTVIRFECHCSPGSVQYQFQRRKLNL